MTQQKYLKYIFLLCIILFNRCFANSQNNDSNDLALKYQQIDAEKNMGLFINNLDILVVTLHKADYKGLKEAEANLNIINLKWNNYYKAEQSVIASNDDLLSIVVKYNNMYQLVIDSIGSCRHRLETIDNFEKYESFLTEQSDVYEKMYKLAMEQSLIKSLAPQLEKLKVKEQLIFNDIQNGYTQAKLAADEIPSLKERMENIENEYIEISAISGKIQEAAFKPYIERIKDYLFSFAAVAIILMFVNMIMSKVKLIKETRKNAKKYKEMMGLNNDEHPTI